MSDLTDAAAPVPDAPYEPPSAGAVLRAAREGAGLSIDAVAQQLKLAPRQVQALESDDFAQLPGRTFVRGFVRNYARYVGLDADDVVALLPGADIAPSLQRPTITPSSRPMGQLPADAAPRRTWTRWAIPLALVAIVGAAGVYELRRPQTESRRPVVESPSRAPAASSVTTGGTTSATLPNPLTSADPGAAPTAAANPASGNVAPGADPSPPSASGPGPAAPGTSASAPTAPGAAPASDAMLVLTFTGSSWVQVKDRNGNVVLAQTGQPGMTQAVSGALPLDIVIGNAPGVSATFRGQPVDLAPHVRANVARLSLK